MERWWSEGGVDGGARVVANMEAKAEAKVETAERALV